MAKGALRLRVPRTCRVRACVEARVTPRRGANRIDEHAPRCEVIRHGAMARCVMHASSKRRAALRDMRCQRARFTLSYAEAMRARARVNCRRAMNVMSARDGHDFVTVV